MKASGADVVLIDPQFAPKVLAKKDAEDDGRSARDHGEDAAMSTCSAASR